MLDQLERFAKRQAAVERQHDFATEINRARAMLKRRLAELHVQAPAIGGE